MPDLIAQGTRPQDRWRRVVPLGDEVILGAQRNRGRSPGMIVSHDGTRL